MPHQRSRAWRRAQRIRFIEKRATLTLNHSDLRPYSHRGKYSKSRFDVDRFRCEKKWTELYLHRVKLKRAHQLGVLWPHPKRKWDVLLETEI